MASCFDVFNKTHAPSPELLDRADRAVDYFHSLVFNARPEAELPEALEGDEQALALRDALMQLREALSNVRTGSFDYRITSKGFLSGICKAIQANMRHASWMARRVADGDMSQRMDFLGDFSDAFNDMTRQLSQVNGQLRAEEERWRLALECSRDGVYEFNFTSGEPPFYSQRLLEMNGGDSTKPQPEEIYTLPYWVARIHPDDTKARDIFGQILAGQYKEETYDLVFRLKDCAGKYCWRHTRGRIFHEEDGSLGRIIGVMEDIHSTKEREEHYLYRATHDSLSGLPNRDLFNQHLNHMLASLRRSMKHGDDVSLLLVIADLDHFKDVNDTRGHHVGDLLLTEFAHLLQSSIRGSDIAARLGGDEFVLLLSCDGDPANHTAAMERLRAAIKQPVSLEGEPYTISASLGVAVAPRDSLDPVELMKCADDALYQVKRSGRDAWRFYQKSEESNA